MNDLPASHNLPFLEALYADYLADPGSVDPAWRRYFDSLRDSVTLRGDRRLGPSFRPRSIFNPAGGNGAAAALSNGVAALAPPKAAAAELLRERLERLIDGFRRSGHLAAQIDPLGLLQRPAPRELDPAHYGLSPADLEAPLASAPRGGPPAGTGRELVEHLRRVYCGSVGVQYMHIDDAEMRSWLQQRMEGPGWLGPATPAEQERLLTRLSEATLFDEFILKRFQGKKSFSLEGGEALIPILDSAIELAAESGAEDVVIGMAHRGRLNVLANIVGKPARSIFREFADLDAKTHSHGGDVKYHLGDHAMRTTAGGREVHVALVFNPSHLEYVNPMVLGRVRAIQDRLGDARRERSTAILVHGDAAFAGEGIVQESLNLSGLDAYTTGGTLHVIVNNQVGFTTDPEDGRCTPYATDVALMLQCPIFHVNCDDPEQLLRVVRVAMEFRHAFKRDVFIDLYCFRRHGHNEQEEGAGTQPVMYRAVAAHKSARLAYAERLASAGSPVAALVEEVAARITDHLEAEFAAIDQPPPPQVVNWKSTPGVWRRYRGGPDASVPDVDTSVPREKLAELLEAVLRIPPDFNLNPRLKRLFDERRAMARGARPLDWWAGETLAYATLAVEGARVRMTGQDCERGTFSHRQAVLHDAQDGRRYAPLQHLAPTQAPVEIRNSPLSEAGVMGFEYGYAIGTPDGLVLWEAQFGDFVNCAQVIIDQFIASCEDKWQRLNGLGLLLPHGFEGQGPEHSSGRLERFLSLCADDNWYVCNLTTPAQMFHCLRRQVLRPWRKPLVIMTPKSLLRHRHAVSSLDDLATGRFERIIPDRGVPSGGVRRVLMCTGKVYYDLLEERERRARHDVAIVRFEQLYPFSEAELREVLALYGTGVDMPAYWVQEEPENMGAWWWLRARFGDAIFGRWPLRCISRTESASPATGSPGRHKAEHDELLAKAFEH